MDDLQRDRLKEVLLLLEAVPLAERRAWVEQRLADDAELRAEVVSLLAVAAAADDSRLRPVVAATGPIADLVVPRRIGPYTIDAVLGQGGMAVVYRASRASPLQQRVALKVLNPARVVPGLLLRFEAERQVIARLEHRNVARLLDAGAADDGSPYLAMEWVDGPTVTDYACLHRLDLPARLRLFLQVCRGVQHAHSRGILHRDLKPSNVLVAEDEHGPVPKVIDFGIARLLAPDPSRPRATAVGEVVGTLEYMSPEQALGGAGVADVRADVFALGVILYELLCGGRPSDGLSLRGRPADELHRTLLAHRALPPSVRLAMAPTTARPLPVRSRIPAEVDCMTMKAIDPDLDLRYGSVAALVDDLERHLAGQAVRARPPTAFYLLRKFARRHRLAMAAATLGLAGLVTAVVVTTVGFTATQRQRDLAEDLVAELTRERDRVDAALVASREVAEFLRELLMSVHPERLGPEATLPDILRAAATRLQQRPPASAIVRARAAYAVAEPLFLMGDRQLAGALLEPVVATLDDDRSEAGLELAGRVRMRLGYVALDREDHLAAQSWFGSALQHGLAHGRTRLCQQARGALAQVALVRGDDERALAWTRELLDGPDAANDPVLRASAAANLGVVLSHLGRTTEAIAPSTLALELRSAAAPRDPATFQCAWNLGLLLLDSEPERGLALIERTAAEARAALGDTHPDLPLADSLLGYAVVRVRGDAAGLERIERSLQQLRESDPGAVRQRQQSFRIAAAVHLGQLATARSWQDEVEAALRAAGTERAVSFRLQLGQLLLAAGRRDDAVRTLTAAFDIAVQAAGAVDHSARVARWLAVAAERGGDTEAAARWRREAAARSAALQGR